MYWMKILSTYYEKDSFRYVSLQIFKSTEEKKRRKISLGKAKKDQNRIEESFSIPKGRNPII